MAEPARADFSNWSGQLAIWAEQRLAAGETALVASLLPEFERTLIRAALACSAGQASKGRGTAGLGPQYADT